MFFWRVSKILHHICVLGQATEEEQKEADALLKETGVSKWEPSIVQAGNSFSLATFWCCPQNSSCFGGAAAKRSKLTLLSCSLARSRIEQFTVNRVRQNISVGKNEDEGSFAGNLSQMFVNRSISQHCNQLYTEVL